jgi:sugar phosphate isomerase/epimerase
VWTLSGFIDEISDDFSLQCTIAGELGLRYVEVRSAWGTNILDLNDGQLSRVRETLEVYGLKVSSIGSPIGKISIDDEFPPHLELMRHAVEVAKTVEAPYIRIFSFFIQDGTNPDSRRDEMLSRMEDLADVAANGDVILVHENEDIYGDIPRRCLDLVFTEAYEMLRPYVSYVQIKDALFANGTVVVAGDGEVPETVRALRNDGFDGFFTLEPHLGEYTAFGALSGPELFTNAWRAFTGILSKEGIQYA